MATPLFAPLSILQREQQRSQRLSRGIVSLASPQGLFMVRPRASAPVGLHPLEFDIWSLAEGQAFLDWWQDRLGACLPFWVPSYQLDLPLLGTIADDDVSFDIPLVGYTRWVYPSLNRRAIAFVRPDRTFMVRRIESATEDVVALTETITINEALGESFTQTPASGICFLWYGRFNDDVLEIVWESHEIGSGTLQMTELHNPPVVESCDLGPDDGTVIDSDPE